MMVVLANLHFPAITAQDVGREVYHGRHEMVRIIGDERSLGKIAWIFQRVPDMFEVQHQTSGLIVRRGGR
ncbi:MAG: hypothetical protein KJ077_26415 [Anaerolineae bacterium]|nr:hypothetical protein [Anaerolineae bacterium]